MSSLRSIPRKRTRLFQPIDIASIVVFRVAFGAILLYEIVRYWLLGRVAAYWIEPSFNFSYLLADWISPLPNNGMHYLWAGLGIMALLIMVGCFYRAAITLFCLGFTYVFLLEEAKYLNHFYFICLISFLMIFIPAHRAGSIDAWLRPGSRAETIPAWCRWALCGMMGIVYFYGGIAKINPDWFQCEPMRFWLANRIDYPVIGRFFEEEWMVGLFSYGGMIFDLTVVPLLIWKRTRWFAFIWAVTFHLLNKWMFGVGIFPWMSIAATTLFFEPDWPRNWGWKRRSPEETETADGPPGDLARRLLVAMLGLFFAIQMVVPFRKHLYPGPVSWTEQGHNFSWHMKLRDKSAEAEFWVTDPADGRRWRVPLEEHLTDRQIHKMSIRPHMILKFAHYLAGEIESAGAEGVEIRAHVRCSLNGRRPQLLVDPTVDLAKISRSLWPAAWISPLTEPLRAPEFTRRQSEWYRDDDTDDDFRRLEGD